jgi:hypothetical protein
MNINDIECLFDIQKFVPWIISHIKSSSDDILLNPKKLSKYEQRIIKDLVDIIKESRLITGDVNVFSLLLTLLSNIERPGSLQSQKIVLAYDEAFFRNITKNLCVLLENNEYVFNLILTQNCDMIIKFLSVLESFYNLKSNEEMFGEIIIMLWDLLSLADLNPNLKIAVLKFLCNIYRDYNGIHSINQKKVTSIISNVYTHSELNDGLSHDIFQLSLGLLVNLLQSQSETCALISKSQYKKKSGLDVILNTYKRKLEMVPADVIFQISP